MEDKLILPIEFDVNNPQLRQEIEQSKKAISGVGQSVSDVERKVNSDLNAISNHALKSKSSFNGLQNSINQLSREIPAFTFSAQTGFMALSNNLPIFADEIGRIRKENEALSASGQKGVPVWKQLLSGLLSWQTAMMVGITLITVYGKEIGEFFKSLIKGNSALDDSKRKLELLNEVRKNSSKTAAEEIASLKILTNVAKDNSKSMDERRRAAVKIQELAKSYNQNISTETILIGNLKNEYKNLTEAIIASAKSKAAEKKIQENAEKRLEVEFEVDALKEANEERKKAIRLEGDKRSVMRIGTAMDDGARMDIIVETVQERIKASDLYTENEIKNTNKRIEALDKEDDFLQQFIKVPLEKKDSKTPKSNIEKQYDSILKISKDGLDKIKALDNEYSFIIINDDDREKALLKQKFADFRKIIVDENEKIRKYNEKNSKTKGFQSVALIDISAVDPIERKANEQLSYTQNTARIKKQFEEEYKVYQEYEELKKSTNEKYANERFSNQLDSIKSFEQRLNSEISSLQGKELNALEKERLDILLETRKANDQRINALQVKMLADAVQEAKTHAQKLEDIEIEYQEKVSALGKNATAEELENLKKVRDEKIKSQNEEFFLKSDLYKKASREALVRTRAEIKEQIKLVEELLKTDLAPNIKERLSQDLSDLKITLSIGSVKTNISNLESLRQDISNAISQYNVDNGIREITDQALEAHPELKKLYDNLKQITAQINTLKKEANDGAGGGFLGFLKKLEGNETLKEISEWGNVAAQSFSQMSQALGGSETQAGYLLGTIGELAGAAADVAGSIASGDPKAIVKSVIGAVSTVFSLSKRTKEMNRQAREENQKFYNEAMKGERDYQALLRQREKDSAARGKNSYKSLISQLEAIKKQSPEVQRAYDKIYKSLQGQDYISGKGYEHGTWFRKAKTWDVMASLRGSDYARLEKLYSEGKLKDKAKEDFESLKALREELEEAGLSVEDLQRSLDELLTGTNVSGLASGLAELFSEGKRSAQDFGDSFESIMRNAIKSSFQAKYLEDAMQPFYNELADLMEGGNLTGEQIQMLKEKYAALGEEYAQKWEDVEKITGVDLSSEESGSSAKNKIDREISEKTGGELLGIFRAGYDISKKHLIISEKALEFSAKSNLMLTEQLKHQAAIEANTAATVEQLQSAVSELKSINKNTSTKGRSAEGMGL